jgi:poly(rC)-binding protein 2/3/4
MPDTNTASATDGTRKRSRSPSDSDHQKQHKRANTGAPTSAQPQDDSTRVALDESNGSVPTATSASLNDVSMTEQSSTSVNDTAASTPTDTAAPGDPAKTSTNTASSTEHASGDGDQAGDPLAASGTSSAPPTPSAQIHMRCLIVTQDASIIIGRGGKHVNEIREKSGARVVVSESIPGNPERILNVSGPLDAVSKVCREFNISRELSYSMNRFSRRRLGSSSEESTTSRSTFPLSQGVARSPSNS